MQPTASPFSTSCRTMSSATLAQAGAACMRRGARRRDRARRSCQRGRGPSTGRRSRAAPPFSLVQDDGRRHLGHGRRLEQGLEQDSSATPPRRARSGGQHDWPPSWKQRPDAAVLPPSSPHERRWRAVARRRRPRPRPGEHWPASATPPGPRRQEVPARRPRCRRRSRAASPIDRPSAASGNSTKRPPGWAARARRAPSAAGTALAPLTPRGTPGSSTPGLRPPGSRGSSTRAGRHGAAWGRSRRTGSPASGRARAGGA